MKLCTYCGSEMADSAEFCSCCGARLSSNASPVVTQQKPEPAPAPVANPTPVQNSAPNPQNANNPWNQPNQNDRPNAAWDRPNQNDMPNAAWDRPSGAGAAPVRQEIKINAQQKDDGFLWTLISFFVPLIGLILWLMWKDEKPLDAMSAAKGALASVSLGCPIVGFVCFFMMKGIYKSVGKACLIASLIGCCFFMLTFMIGLL